MRSWTKQLSTPFLKSTFQSSGTDFKMSHINYCVPSTLFGLETHISILRAGISPHELHTHLDEELIIVLSGKLQIIRSTKTQKLKKSSPLGMGSITYHDSNRAHTVYSVGPEPAVYICIRWNGKKINENKGNVLKSSDFIPDCLKNNNVLDLEFKTTTLFESKTEFLGKLRCHVSHMKPGFGYKPHSDSYDVLIILLDGKIETLQRSLESESVIFYQSGEPHGLKNVGAKLAQYIVFEFHGKNQIFGTKTNMRKIFRFVMKRAIPRKIRTSLNPPK